MRNDLLSIGEVANLKGVSVKALRYYERVGVLRPAYVNPETGYRYYTMRQMGELDVIVSCVQLGVPLRELSGYVSDQGVMDVSALLDRARDLAAKKLRETQVILMTLDEYRAGSAAQNACRLLPAPYERILDARTFLSSPWSEDGFDARRYAKAATGLYVRAREVGLVPLFLQGMMWRADGQTGERSWQVVLEARPLPLSNCPMAACMRGIASKGRRLSNASAPRSTRRGSLLGTKCCWRSRCGMRNCASGARPSKCCADSLADVSAGRGPSRRRFRPRRP